MTAPVNVLLPCRAGSKRIPHKNTRPFAGNPLGLLGLKMEQLAACRHVATLTVTTDDPLVMEIAESMRDRFAYPVHVLERPRELAISDSLDKFVAYIPTIMPPGVVLWTHVTSPFFGTQDIDNAITAYHGKVSSGGFDSLMGVTKIQTFLWQKTRCISHDRTIVKWPQTQDLAPIYEVNSAIFMIDREAMRLRADRIGEKPYLLESGKLASFDVDWPDDFDMAERLMPMPAA